MLLNTEKISLYLRYYTFPFKKFVKAYLSEIYDNFQNKLFGVFSQFRTLLYICTGLIKPFIGK